MKMSEYLENGVKRKLIASMIVGLEKNDSSFDSPVINWFFDFEKAKSIKDKPVSIEIKYRFSSVLCTYQFNKRMIKIIESSLLKFSLNQLAELLPYYNGNMEVNHYYKSEFGKDLPFAKILK